MSSCSGRSPRAQHSAWCGRGHRQLCVCCLASEAQASAGVYPTCCSPPSGLALGSYIRAAQGLPASGLRRPWARLGFQAQGWSVPSPSQLCNPPPPALRHVTSSKTPSAPEWGENHLCGALQRHDILRGRRSPRALERKKHLHAKAILAAAHSTSACACLRGHGRCLPDFELPGKPGAPQSPRRCPQTTAFFALIQDEVTSWKNQAGRWKERFPWSAWRLLPQWDVLRWGRGGASNVWS